MDYFIHRHTYSAHSTFGACELLVPKYTQQSSKYSPTVSSIFYIVLEKPVRQCKPAAT